MCQTRFRTCPSRASTMPTMSGPPASPSRTGMLMPGIQIGITPTSTPRAIPTNSGMNCVSLSSLAESPSSGTTAATSSGVADDLEHVAEPQPQVRQRPSSPGRRG